MCGWDWNLEPQKLRQLTASAIALYDIDALLSIADLNLNDVNASPLLFEILSLTVDSLTTSIYLTVKSANQRKMPIEIQATSDKRS